MFWKFFVTCLLISTVLSTMASAVGWKHVKKTLQNQLIFIWGSSESLHWSHGYANYFQTWVFMWWSILSTVTCLFINECVQCNHVIVMWCITLKVWWGNLTWFIFHGSFFYITKTFSFNRGVCTIDFHSMCFKEFSDNKCLYLPIIKNTSLSYCNWIWKDESNTTKLK